MPNKLKREYEIVKKSIQDFNKMTPEQKFSEGKLQKALSSNPVDKELINRGRRMDLEQRVDKETRNNKNKERGTQSSSVRVPLK